MIKEIMSTTNPTIKFVISLKDKKDIIKNKLCFVEGEKIIFDLINNGVSPYRLFIDINKIEKYRDLVDKYLNITYKVSSVVAKKLSDTVTNPGIFALFELPKSEKFKFNENFLIIDNLQDPSNLGAIIRSALAFGFKNIVTINSVYEYLPKVIRSSMGYVFKVNFVSMTTSQLEDAKKSKKFKLVSANLNGQSLDDTTVDGVYGLIIGNEGNGVSKTLQNISDYTVTIPMNNNVESLNASVSAGILMYNLTK